MPLNRPIRVLHLEDDPRDAELIRGKLKEDGLAVDIVWTNGRREFETALQGKQFDVVLSDFNLPDYDGLSALKSVRRIHPELPVIVISGTVGEDEAVECLKAGATDYVLKQRPQRLGAAVTRALAERVEQDKRRRAETALQESEERFRSAMHYSAIGMALVAPDGRWLEVNRALCQLTGYQREELLARDFQSITHPEDLPADLACVRRMLAREIDSYQLEKRYIRKDGGIVWIALGVSLLLQPDGTPRHFISQIQDITLRKQQDEKIARLSRIHTLLSGINALIVRTRDRHQLFEEACRLAVEKGGFAFAWIGIADASGSKATPLNWAGAGSDYLVEVGSALKRMGEDPGIAARALRQQQVIVVNDIEHDPEVSSRDEMLSRGFRSAAVFALVNEGEPAGIFVLYSQTVEFFDVEEIKLLTELAGDISFALDHISKEKKLDYLAYFDALTALPNRALFLDRCNQLLRAAINSGKSVALILVDFERFRHVNETLGRHAGDALLKRAAIRLKAVLQGAADVARISGNIFALVIPGMRDDAEAARLFEHEINPALSAPIEFEGNEYRLSVKAGVALGPRDGASAEELLQNAEAALAGAKRTATRCLFYEPQMNARVGERLALESSLRAALEKNQFVLYYQPKFDVRSGTITGLEALIRWIKPSGELVPPAQFIHLLEETGLILEVGRWAMRQASTDYEKWLAEGFVAPRIAVNVSAIQLRQRNFSRTVREVIADRTSPGDASGGGLDLEITESLVMEDIDANIANLKAIREMGVGIYVDDFGTGYSSLSYLARLPISALKIDRSFISNMTTSTHDHSIVSTIISLAHSLNLSVVAEGVETEQQFAMLKAFGCDEVQGYLFSRPVPAGELATLLRKRS
jgi:PAS domain S-box-containing protein/diguanylate cyclase (GGDEF)-like protein